MGVLWSLEILPRDDDDDVVVVVGALFFPLAPPQVTPRLAVPTQTWAHSLSSFKLNQKPLRWCVSSLRLLVVSGPFLLPWLARFS